MAKTDNWLGRETAQKGSQNEPNFLVLSNACCVLRKRI